MKAFTIIELIFVIVLVGLLAVIALPKLSATRQDAIDAKRCKNISACIMDMASLYTAHNHATLIESDACNRVSGSGVTLSNGGETIIISGAPNLCSYLDQTYTFGGNRISF